MNWLLWASLAASTWAYDARTFLALPNKSLSVLKQEVTQLIEKKPDGFSGGFASFSKNGDWVLLRAQDGRIKFKNLEGGFELEFFWNAAVKPGTRGNTQREIYLSPRNLRVEAPLGWDWAMRPDAAVESASPKGRVKSVWFGAQGKWALSEGLDGSVKLWSLSADREPETLSASSLLPDEGEIAMLSSPSLWKRIRQLFRRDKPLPLRFAAYTAGGLDILAVKDSRLRFRDIRSGESLKDSPKKMSPIVYSGVYEPQKDRLAVDTLSSTALFSN